MESLTDKLGVSFIVLCRKAVDGRACKADTAGISRRQNRRAVIGSSSRFVNGSNHIQILKIKIEVKKEEYIGQTDVKMNMVVIEVEKQDANLFQKRGERTRLLGNQQKTDCTSGIFWIGNVGDQGDGVWQLRAVWAGIGGGGTLW